MICLSLPGLKLYLIKYGLCYGALKVAVAILLLVAGSVCLHTSIQACGVCIKACTYVYVQARGVQR